MHELYDINFCYENKSIFNGSNFSGSKRLRANEVTRVGTLYKSPTDIDPPIWGHQNVLKWVNAREIAQKITSGLESVKISNEVKFAVSLVAPSSFHQSVLGNVQNEINLHIDIVCSEDSIDEVVSKSAHAIETDFLQPDNKCCIPLLLQVSGSRPASFNTDNFSSVSFKELLQTSTKLQSFQMFNNGGNFFKVSKSFTIFRVWKKLGKFFTSSIGTPPLLNLINGVLINSSGAELYESTLLQCSLLDQEAMATRITQNPGSKNVSTLLSTSHPSVISSAREVCNQFLSSSCNIDILRFSQGLLWDYFISPNDSSELEGILQDIFSLHRSTAAKFYNLSLQYKALETYFLHSKEDPEDILKSVSNALGNISASLNDISYHSHCAPVQKWYAQVLENNVYILDGMIHDQAQYNNVPAIIGVEKVSCKVAAFFFLPPIMTNLECLSVELEKSNRLSHFRVEESVSVEVPPPDVELGFYEPSMNKPYEFGVDLVKNSSKIQSAANMHTIAVLLQYQSDMYVDSTLETVINSITCDFPINPYREFVTECLISSHKVETGCITGSSIIDLLRHKPKLRSTDHQIFCIEGSIFGLHHSVLQADPEGLGFILSVCKAVQNNPFITKKDGVRIMHTTFPCADYLVCGRLRPMIYSMRCEEYYVMIKETKSADADIGLNFLTEMIYLHLVDMSKSHIVIGYSVDDDDVVLLNMSTIQARQSEKSMLVSELHEVMKDRSQLTLQYFVKTELGHYIKVIKDIKPIYADQSADLYDHYTPCNALNANFAVFSKLYPANFFYDYAEGTSAEDLEFVLDQLNRTIVQLGDSWNVYQTIQLKHMLKQDDGFLPCAFYMAHSTCSKLRGLQELNETISDVLSLSSRTDAHVDISTLKEMIIDLVTHSKETLKNISSGELLSKYVETFLKSIYNSGEPVLDERLEKSLKSLFIIFSSLAQYFEKEFTNSSSYKLQPFVAEAAAEIKLKLN